MAATVVPHLLIHRDFSANEGSGNDGRGTRAGLFMRSLAFLMLPIQAGFALNRAELKAWGLISAQFIRATAELIAPESA